MGPWREVETFGRNDEIMVEVETNGRKDGLMEGS